MNIYAVLNVFFFLFHSLWILFNLTGWIWTRSRRIHLVTLLLTGGSWFILGIWKGMGYCPCTDWHWSVRAKLGYFSSTDSYIAFLIEAVTGLRLPGDWVNGGVVILYLAALVLSIRVNLRGAVFSRKG